MTSLDAVAALFLFFFIVQFVLFLMLCWIVRKYLKALRIMGREFQKYAKFWHARANKEAFMRDLEKTGG